MVLHGMLGVEVQMLSRHPSAGRMWFVYQSPGLQMDTFPWLWACSMVTAAAGVADKGNKGTDGVGGAGVPGRLLGRPPMEGS